MPTRKYAELRAKMSPERRAKVDALVKKTLEEMPLNELRNARQMTQVNLAQILEVQHGEISKIEKRTDMYISTLRSYIEAMGGTLELRAVFPDGAILIKNFQELT